MTQQEVFEYLRDNLHVDLNFNVNHNRRLESSEVEVKIDIGLVNPATDELETIAECTKDFRISD